MFTHDIASPSISNLSYELRFDYSPLLTLCQYRKEVGWDEGTPKLPRAKMIANFSVCLTDLTQRAPNVEPIGYCLLILQSIGLIYLLV